MLLLRRAVVTKRSTWRCTRCNHVARRMLLHRLTVSILLAPGALGCAATPAPDTPAAGVASAPSAPDQRPPLSPAGSGEATAPPPDPSAGVHESSPPAPSEAHAERQPEAREGRQPEAHPAVAVRYIGMHIGGGPNDAATKAPFEATLGEKRDTFASCYAEVDTPGARGTFGIDLLIAANGGHPQTSNVRTVLSGDGFRRCMVEALESAEFKPPKHGKTKLSYALRFEPTGAPAVHE